MCRLKFRKMFMLMFIITSCIVCSTFMIITLLLPPSIISIVLTIVIIATLVGLVSIYILKKEININISSNSNSNKIIDENVIVSESDLKGNITEASEAFCQISGYAKDELIGKPHNILRHPDMPAEAFEDLWNTIKSDKVWKGEVKNLKKDGGYYWVMATITKKYDKNNNHIGYISVRQDITNKKRFEELNDTLEHRIKLAVEDSSKKEKIIFESEKMVMLGEMIGNIAHQWRQPLTVISAGATGLLMQKEYGLLTDEVFEKACTDINDNAQYLSETIDTFKNFIKDEKKLETVILQDRINNALKIVEPNLASKYITLNNNIDYTEPINITIIIGELSQVMINIFNNAKDVLIERAIEEPIINLDIIKKDDKVIITIEDNAGGVPNDIINRIFEPYFTTKHESIGTGLGLHMSYKIMKESLNGNLYVKNTDIGAKFFIELPR